MAEVVLENVSRVYPGGAVAVDAVDLQVRDQELLVLVGPSGCGKSTTLRMIAGLEDVTSGTIRIGERVVNDVAPRDRDIAMVFQNYALYPHMTVRKNMAFGLELRYGGSWPMRLARRLVRPHEATELAQRRRGIDQKVRTVAETLGLGKLLERLPGQLSGGERQRVALGRAIVREPVAFLFDEPLSNLDAKLRVEMRKELKQLHERLRTTMIYVTHDQVEALTLGERVAVMHGGKLQQVGPALEVYDKPQNQFVAGFIGTPPMNFLHGELVLKGDQLQFENSAFCLALPDGRKAELQTRKERKVTLGIRPEDVRMQAGEASNARVTLVEPLGDATLVYLELDRLNENGAGETVIGKTSARRELTAGMRVQVACDPVRTHLFDPESGARLGI